MRPLSASEAISPALERTRDLLGRPFRWRTFLKITAVAFFAEIGGSGLNFPSRGGNLHHLPPAFLAFIVAFAVILGVVTFLIGLLLLYLASRLQLVLVGVVATRDTYIRPHWQKAGQPIWRWIGLKLLFFLFALLAALILALPLILYFATHGAGLRTFAGGAFPHLPVVQIILVILAILFFALLISAAYMLLRDFALPSLALEDVPLSEALRRVRLLLVTEPGAVALFLLLRILLIFVFAIGAEILLGIVLLLSLIPFGIAGGVLWFVLHNAGPAGIAILVISAVVGGLIFFCWLVCLCFSALGPVYVFSQAYSLYFLGGRYPLLGDMLDRSTPPPSYAYPIGFAQHPPPYYPPQPGPPPTERNPNP